MPETMDYTSIWHVCPSDIVDAIGGWKTAGVGHVYGDGYKMEVLNNGS